VTPEGVKGSPIRVGTVSGARNVQYQVKVRTWLNEPTKEGRHVAGAIEFTVGEDRKYQIGFDARVRLAPAPTEDYPKLMAPIDAVIEWRLPAPKKQGNGDRR